MAVFPNKYAKKCNNPACNTHVEIGAGFIQKINGQWLTWCKNCVPERITADAVPFVQRVLTSDGKIVMPYEPASLPLIKSLKGPGGSPWPKWDAASKSWAVSLEQADRPRLLEVADKLKLDVAPSLRKVVLTEAAQNAVVAGLYPFQVDGVNWLNRGNKRLLGDEMGLGKTVMILHALDENDRALVIAPAGLKYNWADECKRWRPNFKVTVLESKADFRFPQVGEVLITNYEAVPEWLETPSIQKGEAKAAYWKRVGEWQTKLIEAHPEAKGVILVGDEIHKLKNYKSKRSMRFKNLCRTITKQSGKIWALTGTPLDNRAEDLYGILDATDMAFDVFTPSRKGQSPLKRFQELFGASSGRFGTHYGSPSPIVPELLRRVMLRRKRAEVLPDLPRKTYSNLTVGDSIDKNLKRQLDNMWEQYGTMIEVDETLPPFEEFSKIRAALAKSRIPAMLEYIEDCEEQDVPLVVFSAHLAPMDALLGRPGWALITGETSPQKRQEIVRAFQNGQLKGVGVTIRAGGVGLTLTRAWKALFVDLDWVPGWNAQAEDRLARIGQKANQVEIVRMVSDHPLDVHVLNLLAAKIALIEAAVERSYTVNVNKVQSGDVKEETEEEFNARMKAIQLANEELEKNRTIKNEEEKKAKAKAKVSIIHDREKKKAAKPLLPLTPDRAEAVRNAFGYMLSVCDGAVRKDWQGFNAPDSCVAHWVLATQLENQHELETAYFMLSRYHRQLEEKFPKLFN